jgi:hypothetical protein
MNFQITAPQHLPPKVLVSHAFVDGAYLGRDAEFMGIPFPNAASAVEYVARAIRDMGGYSAMMAPSLMVNRTRRDAACSSACTPSARAGYLQRAM